MVQMFILLMRLALPLINSTIFCRVCHCWNYFIGFFFFQGGQTPMHVATYYGNVTLVLILLQHGGSPDFTNVVSTLFILFQNYCSHFLCPVIYASGLVGTYMYVNRRVALDFIHRPNSNLSFHKVKPLEDFLFTDFMIAMEDFKSNCKLGQL